MDGTCDVVRIHAAAGLALIQRRDKDGATQWIPWSPAPAVVSSLGHFNAVADEPPSNVEKNGDAIIDMVGRHSHVDALAAPSLALRREDFDDARVAFEVLAPSSNSDALPPQNVVVFLHGRGDSHAPFARLGQQMALPQTAVISLRAPLELPFDMGYTWIDDLDSDFNVIPPTIVDAKRSESLQAARAFVLAFLTTLRDRYHWRLDRVFLFGFSQGASVAFHVARTLPCRLGGVVLVAGGAVNGPHNATDGKKLDHETPVLLICGGCDDVFPLSLAEYSEQLYAATFQQPTLLSRHVIPHKMHDMIRSRDEMRIVMEFFSTHLYLRNAALENRSDIIEITGQQRATTKD